VCDEPSSRASLDETDEEERVTEIGGRIEPGFEGVAEAFRANFDHHGEVGAATAVYVGGQKVVDLWGGVADPDAGTPYTEDSLQLVFSTTKGATAACANLLAQRGDLDMDAPVAEYWPEFKAAGKAEIPVRWLLCHKAGLPYVDTILTLDEALAWEPMIGALEAQEPVWEPGTAHGYHATTYGWLVGEVVKRISGKSLGTFFQDEIARPLDLEFWIGLPDEQQHRVAPLQQWGELGGGLAEPRDPALAKMLEQFIGPDSLLGKALAAPNGVFNQAEGRFNNPAVRAAEIPAANGVTNARSLARFYAGLTGTVEGGPASPLLGAEQVAKASERQTFGPDKCLYFESTFGLGFFVASPFAPYGGPKAFGHTGAGGSVGFTDPEHGIGFGYVMNKMGMSLNGDPRSGGLIKAVYAAIGVEPTYV
jgi:CubicO group peptidase (beta-lactamase class C family)